MTYMVIRQIIHEGIPISYFLDESFEPFIQRVEETEICTFISEMRFCTMELIRFQRKLYVIQQIVSVQKGTNKHIVLYVKEYNHIPFNHVIYTVETDAKKYI